MYWGLFEKNRHTEGFTYVKFVANMARAQREEVREGREEGRGEGGVEVGY